MSVAKSLNDLGKRREAITVCQTAIDLYSQHDATGTHPLPIIGPIFGRLGMLYYEANQLKKAHTTYEQGLELCQQLGFEYDFTFIHGLSATTLYALGETEAAFAALQTAYRIAAKTGYGDADWFLDMEADLRLRQGDIAAVRRWTERMGLSLSAKPELMRIYSHLLFARLLLVQRRLSDVRRWLARLEAFMRENGLSRWLLSVYILQALAAEYAGEHELACELMARAIEIAAPEDYIRAFLDEDATVMVLLPEVREVAPRFVNQVLDAAGVSLVAADATPSSPVQPLIEPLSERELEVLRLIAAGLSNREIAEELYITVGTVKRHINNIYGKLQVHRRTEAVAQARELGIL